jgi:hypothetical protein
VEDGRTGFLIPTRALPAHSSWDEILALRHDRVMHLFSAQSTAVDLEQAAARILQLGADRGLARTMGEAARERAREFTWPRVIEAYLGMWSELLAAESRPQQSGRSSALRIPMEFGGYPTAVLGPSDEFRTTEFGERVMAGQAAIHLYFETDEFLDRELMGRILRACTVSAPVSQLWTLSERPGPDASHTVNQNVIWLYKQGFLRSTGPSAQGGSAGLPRG